MKRDAGSQLINNEFHFPLNTSRHGGIANLANDGNNIISASGRDIGKGTVAVKRVTGAFNISDLTMKATKSNTLAVENALTHESTKLSNDFARHINRQLYADGVGVVGQVLGSVSGTSFSITYPDANLDDARSIDWYGSINGDIAKDKYIGAPDQILGIGTGGVGTATVSSTTGTSINLTGTVASVANDSLYLVDGSGQGAGTSEIQGIRAALSSTTGTSLYAGVARSTIGWTPQFGSASEALTQGRISSTYIKAREFSDVGDKYAIFMNATLYDKYGNILIAMRRTVDETDLLGGWTGLSFAAGAGKVGVFLDYEVPDGEFVVIDLDTWAIAQVAELDFLEGGNNLLRLQNSTLYQTVLVWYANVICLAPAANGRHTRKSN